MAKTTFIITDLSRLPWYHFLNAVRAIIAGMTGNAYFPEPPYPIADISTKLADLQVFTDKQPHELSGVDRNTRDKIREEIELRVTVNGVYVTLVAPGDKDKQESSGYSSIKARVNHNQPPETPTEFRVRKGKKSGEVILNCKKRPGTKSLEIQYWSDDPNEPVRTHITNTSVGILITGLTPGRHYFFKIRAIGKRNVPPSDWSGVIDIWAS